jgi:fucose permease
VSDLKLGDTDLANMLGAFFPGYMITQIPSGPIIQKYGGKPLLLLVMLGRGTPLAGQ